MAEDGVEIKVVVGVLLPPRMDVLSIDRVAIAGSGSLGWRRSGIMR